MIREDEEPEIDYCNIPLRDIRDEGPLVAAAGYLTTGCKAIEAGECGPHAALPILYSLRFAIELTLHGATQALEEGRSCSGRTGQKTHVLQKLFQTWETNLQNSSQQLGYYDGSVPNNSDLKDLVQKFHELDPDGTCLRYPVNFPEFANVCDAINDAQFLVEAIVDRTSPLVPNTKRECQRRLAFLRRVAEDPCECIGPISDFHDLDDLITPTPGQRPSVWPL